MTPEEIKEISNKVESEGFDYAFSGWGSFDNIKDQRFQDYKLEFIKARKRFQLYLKHQGVEL